MNAADWHVSGSILDGTDHVDGWTMDTPGRWIPMESLSRKADHIEDHRADAPDAGKKPQGKTEG